MFADYKAQVFLAYQKRRNDGNLSLNLIRPTRAKLKQECLDVFADRDLKKDENILKLFFGPGKDAHEYVQNIRRFETDKFKPLDNFLKKKTNETDDKNIELLAWLINFEPRPYRYGNTYKEEVKPKEESVKLDDTDKKEDIMMSTSPVRVGEKESNGKRGEGIHLVPTKKPAIVITKSKSLSRLGSTSKFKKAIISFILIIAAGSGAYLFLGTKAQISNMPQSFMSRNGNCMYWTGEQYQPISCEQKIGDKPIVPLDTAILAQLKKITNPDTITTQCLGKVWYVKINGEPEFYTSNGFHPIYTDKRLRPITPYIINKYVRR